MRRAASKTTSHSSRLLGLVLPALLAVTLLLPATAVSAAPSGAATAVLLAAEEGGPEGPQGPEPADPNDTENPAAPENYEAPFLWAASVGLLALAILGTLLLAGLYYLLVHRPQQDEKTAGRK
jgi:hypothetical protein